MAQRSTVDLVREWQDGALLVAVCVLVGVAVGAIVGEVTTSGIVGVAGFLVGAIGTFLAVSYFRHGR